MLQAQNVQLLIYCWHIYVLVQFGDSLKNYAILFLLSNQTNPIRSYPIQFFPILFYFSVFYSIPAYSILIYSILINFTLINFTLIYFTLIYSFPIPFRFLSDSFPIPFRFLSYSFHIPFLYIYLFIPFSILLYPILSYSFL